MKLLEWTGDSQEQHQHGVSNPSGQVGGSQSLRTHSRPLKAHGIRHNPQLETSIGAGGGGG